MTFLRPGVFALGLTVALAAFGAGRADDQKKQPDARGRFQQLQQFQVGRAGGPLITAETKDKLNLTADQKEKIAKLEKEFEDKSKETMTKSRETIQKAIQEKDIAALQQMRDVLQANRNLRTEYEGKVSALLTDEQKKKFEEAKSTARRPGGNLPNLPNLQNLRPASRGDSQGLQSKEVQDKLNLTAEQKEKLEKLQKEFEAKQLEVLTAEQKKKFEEIKKQPARPNFRPNPRRPGVDKK